jgi:hypothetical protein
LNGQSVDAPTPVIPILGKHLPTRIGKLAARLRRTNIEPMQFHDLINRAGNGWVDTVKIVLFKMLPRGAQIQKVRAEVNRGILKKYGKLTRLEIDNENKTINADLDLKGEKEGIQVRLSNYLLHQEEGKNPYLETGSIKVSREWIDALLKTLVKKGVVPQQIELKNQLHQAVVKALL